MKVGELEVHKVRLVGGPHDGGESISSCDTAIVDGEIYVDDGQNAGRFVHALEAINKMPEWARKYEQEIIADFLKRMCSLSFPNLTELGNIPSWRVNAWFQLFRYGVIS